jgi:hypothetical protein
MKRPQDRCTWIASASLLLAQIGPAAAQRLLEPESVRVVGRAAAGRPWTDAPTEARLADGAELAVVLLAREPEPSGRTVCIAEEDIEPLLLRGRRCSAAERRPWSALRPASVRWSLVEPHAWRPQHVPAGNGADTPFYSNVSMDRKSFGRWLGFATIAYFETVLDPWSSAPEARRRAATVSPSEPGSSLTRGLGTIRYKAEVRLDGRDGRILSTPGAEAVDRYGILPSVHRVSIRSDDTFLGYLGTYFLVPEVFGSAGPGPSHQTERYAGADCADVLIGALRAMGHKDVPYGSVAALPRHAKLVAGPALLDQQGNAPAPLEGVREGDLIRIDYRGGLSGSTPRSWDHVAALFRDLGGASGPEADRPNGRLDGFDLIVHMGHPRLVVEPLSRQAPARIDVLRWDPARLGPRRTATGERGAGTP